MALLTWLKSRVQKPGIRGGRGYWDAKGEWRYGDRPGPGARVPIPDGRLSIELRRQKIFRFRGQRIDGPEDVAAAFRGMVDLDRERVWTVSVDRRQRILGIECVSIGTVDQSFAVAREVLKSPVALGAAAVYLVHNHPAGISTPSPADRQLLDNLRQSSERLGVRMHGIVVARDGFASVATLEDPPEPTMVYPEAAGRFAPPEVEAIRLTSFGAGSPMESPHEIAVLGRALLDPGQRTLVALPLDNRRRVLGAFGLGVNLMAPRASILNGFTRLMVAHSPTRVAIVAGRNGDAWSGGDSPASGLLAHWVGELRHVTDHLGVEMMDCIVVGQTDYLSLRTSQSGALPTQASEVSKARVFVKGSLFRSTAPAGKIALGKTRSGKDVFASAAESGDYSDDDHQDAAQLHAAATAHHEHMGKAHRAAAEGDDDWKRSEAHHQAAERHDALTTHHFRAVRQHLVAGGHGGEVALSVNEGEAALSRMKPHGRRGRSDAKAELAKRTHHDHPGGVTDADKAAYARFPAPRAAEPDARADDVAADETPARRRLRFTGTGGGGG